MSISINRAMGAFEPKRAANAAEHSKPLNLNEPQVHPVQQFDRLFMKDTSGRVPPQSRVIIGEYIKVPHETPLVQHVLKSLPSLVRESEAHPSLKNLKPEDVQIRGNVRVRVRNEFLTDPQTLPTKGPMDIMIEFNLKGGKKAGGNEMSASFFVDEHGKLSLPAFGIW